MSAIDRGLSAASGPLRIEPTSGSRSKTGGRDVALSSGYPSRGTDSAYDAATPADIVRNRDVLQSASFYLIAMV